MAVLWCGLVTFAEDGCPAVAVWEDWGASVKFFRKIFDLINIKLSFKMIRTTILRRSLPLQERMVEEHFKVHPFFGVPPE